MAYEITSDCICCGACQPACPMESIAEEADTYRIDPERCTDCGACADACPVGAIRRIG